MGNIHYLVFAFGSLCIVSLLFLVYRRSDKDNAILLSIHNNQLRILMDTEQAKLKLDEIALILGKVKAEVADLKKLAENKPDLDPEIAAKINNLGGVVDEIDQINEDKVEDPGEAEDVEDGELDEDVKA